MPVTIAIELNRFSIIASALPAAMDAVADHAAQVLNDAAINNAPVDTGAMKASIKKEKIGEGEYEVSVQKDEALAGEKTYAWFNDAGTVHYSGSHFFQDACQSAVDDLVAASHLAGF